MFDMTESESDFTYSQRFNWSLRYKYLGERAVLDEIIAEAKKIGKPLRGHPQQCISSTPASITKGIQTGDAEVLNLCEAHAIDPAKSMRDQNREAVRQAAHAFAANGWKGQF